MALSLGCAPTDELASYSDAWSPPLEGGNEDGSSAPPAVTDSTESRAGGEAPPGRSGAAATPPMVEAGTEAPASSESPPPISGVDAAPADDPAGGAGVGSGGEEPADAEPAGPAEFRFVRLVADSDFAEGPLTSVAEFNVLDRDGNPIDRAAWLAEADSEEARYVGGAPASFAIDGAPATMWHTAWFQVTPPPHPHTLEIDMGAAHVVGGFRYLARQDRIFDGRVARFRFYVSPDGVDWGEPAAEGTLQNVNTEQDVAVSP